MRHLYSFLTVIVFLILFAGSATQKSSIASVPLKVGAYSFAPPQTAPPGSAKISFLLIDPCYAMTFKYSGIKVFSDFSKAMSGDMNQTLTAKGYFVRGPYQSYDDAVYDDKKGSDLMLKVDIDPDLSLANVQAQSRVVGFGQYQRMVYTFNGFMVLSGKVNLVASEALTREKLWAKSIPLEQKQVQISSSQTYQSPQDFAIALTNDPGVVNPLVDAMEGYYKSVFATAWDHLDPHEFQPLKASVKEIRSNSNLIQH